MGPLPKNKDGIAWHVEKNDRSSGDIFQLPIYLEPSSQLPIYQVTIDPRIQIYRELTGTFHLFKP